jgi:cell wall-associated NlpC family hydrolase
VQAARKGDLILFTGTDRTVRIVGHMGIVTENTDSLRFIHSTSGRQYSVTVTALNEYYKGRFVKVIDIW